MTRSVYVVGGAGTGKSTFTAELLEVFDVDKSFVFHRRRKSDGNLDPISGHLLRTADPDFLGLYIGKLRESFPGTDGLSRSCTPVGVEWLHTASRLPDVIVAEGATLATQGFLSTLAEVTELMLVHLRADPNEVARRMLGRGSSQAEAWVKGSVTRAATAARVAQEAGALVLECESDYPDSWEFALAEAISWMGFTSSEMRSKLIPVSRKQARLHH
jgi:hypothetical protein